jgi:hypothetical protein
MLLTNTHDKYKEAISVFFLNENTSDRRVLVQTRKRRTNTCITKVKETTKSNFFSNWKKPTIDR